MLRAETARYEQQHHSPDRVSILRSLFPWAVTAFPSSWLHLVLRPNLDTILFHVTDNDGLLSPRDAESGRKSL